MGQYKVYLLEYQSTETAEAGTSTSQIKITGHGLSALDMVVNTTRRSTGAERGSRLVYNVGLDADTIPIETSMTSQAAGDSIRLYKYVDRSGLLRPGTFRLIRRGAGQSEASFEIKTDSSLIVKPGQYVRITYTNDLSITTYHFSGVVTSATRRPVFDGSAIMFQTIQCQGMNQIPTRRTIRVDYPAGTDCGDIVTDMVDDYLYQDGIRKTTINTGAALEEDWQSDVISIADVLDQCASLSGYQWYINDEGQMTFYQDDGSIADAAHALDGTFTDYTNLEFAQDINNYANKVFLAGGVDETGNDIIIGSEDFTETSAMQAICAGTGVYGLIIRDTSIVESDYRTAEASSTTTTINITGHGQEVGDMVWNYTRDEYRQVLTKPSENQFTVDAFSNLSARTSDTAEAGTTTTNIKMTAHGLSVGEMIYNSTRSAYRIVLRVDDVDNITVEAVTGQTSGDTIYRGGDIIVFFNQANDIIQNTIKKQGTYPETVSFETTANDFLPLTKLSVNLADYGVNSEYYLIEDVEVYDKGKGLSDTWCRVKATRRDNGNLSTQRLRNGYDYWRDR